MKRNSDAGSSNEAYASEPEVLPLDAPKKRGRKLKTSVGTRFNTPLKNFSSGLRSKRAKNRDEEEHSAKTSSPSMTTRSRRVTNERPPPRVASTRTRGQNWSPEYLLSEPKSKLVHCNLNVIALKSVKLIEKELINKHAWEMLTPEDQAECMSYLPTLDIVFDKNDTDTTSPETRLRDGFFEKNSSLQDDIRTFQVSSNNEVVLIPPERSW